MDGSLCLLSERQQPFFAVAQCVSSRADIIVDPDGTGATDVVKYPNGSATPITNPVPDPLSVDGDLAVGNTADGSLAIRQGGVVAVTDSYSGTYIGYDMGSSGSVTIDGAGSRWNGGYDFYVGYRGTGTLSISNGRVVAVTDTFSGCVIGGYDSGSKGTLEVGIGPDGTGLLDIESSLQIGETSTLLVTIDDRIFPAVGEQFTVVTFGYLTGTFTNKPTPSLAGDYLLDWAVHYNAHDITLEAVSAILAADFNDDGTVDGDDFPALQGGFGTQSGAAHAQGDSDADGDVDGNDFLRWQQQFGRTAGASGATAVPEPTSLCLVLGFALLLTGVRRRTANSKISR